MLILTRKVGEAVLIGDDVTVRVLHSAHGIVKLGFDAPKDVNIIRDELKEKLEAAGVEVSGTKDNIARPRYRELK